MDSARGEMPVWLEILLDVIAYAGFVCVATINPFAKEAAARQARGEGVN